MTTQDGLYAVPMSHLAYRLAFNRLPYLVLQDDRINTLPALHAAEKFYVLLTYVIQFVFPLGHEQASAPIAGCCRKTLFLFHFPSHGVASRFFLRAHGVIVWLYLAAPRSQSKQGITLARIIHEGFYYNSRYTALTGLTAGGLAVQLVNILFKYASLPRGSARPSRVASQLFRHELQ